MENVLRGFIGTVCLAAVGLLSYVTYRSTKIETPTVITIESPRVNMTAPPTVTTAATKKNTSVASFLPVPKDAKVILLDAEVFMDSVGIIIRQMEEARKAGIKRIFLVITSPGGSVVAGGRLIAYMDAVPMQIDTVCETFCASMAAHIHQAGKNRYMVDRSLLMFHRASGAVQGTLEQMDSEISMYRDYVNRLDQNAATKAGIPFEQFKEIMGRDLWIDGQSALNMGLTDKLVFLAYDVADTTVFSLKAQLIKDDIEVPEDIARDTQKILENLR